MKRAAVKMTLEEAIAVHLYLEHDSSRRRNGNARWLAWQVIGEHAIDVLRREGFFESSNPADSHTTR
jgi:hypothetical protein